jgi:uncharacterized protein YrrD
MRYRAREIIGCAIHAADGEVGHVRDVYFDDETWLVRYVVVDTGGWLSSQEVLLVPSVLTGREQGDRAFTTALTRQQVKDSPPVTADMPLSRQYEERLHAHYGWLPYWDMPVYASPGLYSYPPLGGVVPPVGEGAAAVPGEGAPRPRSEEREIIERAEAGDPHLRSFREVKGYRVEARDGRIGHVMDALVQPEAWRISHLVIDTRNWLPGKHVVVDTKVARSVDWSEARVVVDLSRDEVRAAPELESGRLGIDLSAAPP